MPSGKKTFIDGPHASVLGALIPQMTLDVKQQAKIERLIDRPLSSDECCYLSERSTTLRGLMDAGKDLPPRQDLRVTLIALAAIDHKHAVTACENSDAQTQSLIARGLYLNGDFTARPGDLKPEEIRQAAQRAVDSLPKGAPGRPTLAWHAYFADFSRQAWRYLGQSDFKVWRSTDGKGSRFVEFACVLLDATGRPLSISAVEKILRSHDPK